MNSNSESFSLYEQHELNAAEAAIRAGHALPEHLRALLILTTSKTTCSKVMGYFAGHQDDRELVAALVEIASEGEDAGDAPWAAANVLSECPAVMLAPHRNALIALSQESWTYLSEPGKRALAKIAG